MNKTFIERTECALAALPPATRGAAIFRDIRPYHIDVDELAETAAEAAVQTLALTHLVPIPVRSRRMPSSERRSLRFTRVTSLSEPMEKRLTLELD